MKKIAILTQSLGPNYGGIIQNFALQNVLKNLECEPITIDRRENKLHSTARLLLSNIKSNIYKKIFKKNLLTRSDYIKITENTTQFLSQHIRLSSKIESTLELRNYFQKENFDVVVVGSDQTWRPKYSPDIFNFYLDFLEENDAIKKIAYASSFGTSQWEYSEEQTNVCKRLIKQFDAISVREASGVELCHRYLETEAIHLLDPTLLLSGNDYDQLIQKERGKSGLFTYILDGNPEKHNFISKAAKKFGLKISTSQAEHKFDSQVKRPLSDYILPPLEGWLQGFRDAEFVITDSFHGTVFSILFQKPFFSIVNKERGASRFESLLGKLGLKDRMVYNITDFDVSMMHDIIDYETVNQRLEELKRESLNFLKENL